MALIRAHRRLLEDEKYITCEKNQHSPPSWLIVTDDGSSGSEGPESGAESAEISGTLEFESTPQSAGQSAGQSVGQTILSQAQNSVPSYSHISHINITHNTEEEEDETLYGYS